MADDWNSDSFQESSRDSLQHSFRDALQHSLRDSCPSDEICPHTNLFQSDTGKGYCCDCGLSLDACQTVSQTCRHESMYKSESGLHICSLCSKEIEVFSHDAEWRYYDHGGSADPSRCHAIQTDVKSLKKTFEVLNIHISDAIRHQVEQDFSVIVGQKTLRSRNRNSIIAACLFHAYIKLNECRTNDYIRHLFDLTKRDMSRGIKEYQKIFPESRTLAIRPHDLISWIFSLTGIDRVHYRNVIRILDYIHKTSETLNRSTVQSVANAVVYFYLCLNVVYKQKLGLTKSSYAEKVDLSEITISKLVKEISLITGQQVKV